MSKPESQDLASPSATPVPAQEWPKQCGTETTPPCPLEALYIERNAVIYQLAGPHPSRERVARVAAQVDQYMITALRGVLALVQHTAEPTTAK